jgi:integrase
MWGMGEKLSAPLSEQSNDNTSRARAAAQRDYLQYVGDSTKRDLSGWISNMKYRGLAVNTIRQRVCLIRKWLGSLEDVVLPSRSNIRTDTWLTREQLQVLLAAIPKNKGGRHDFALITVLLVTGLKLQKARALRWKDFNQESAKIVSSADRIPQVVLNAIEMIESATRDSQSPTVYMSDTQKGDEYIFTAFCPRSPRTKSQQFSISGKKQPLSIQEINRRIKRYARLAGLDVEGISTETLRRTKKRLGGETVSKLVQEAFASRNTGPVRWKRVDRDQRLHGIGRRRR